jgi:hypothetical protein
MLQWCAEHGFGHPSFAGMIDLVNYYGGVGAPRVIVLGGVGHTVFHNESEHHESDNATLLAAINNALAVAVVGEVPSPATLNYWPNPVNEVLYVEGGFREARVFDQQGRAVLLPTVNAGSRSEINVAGLPAGVYVFQVVTTRNEWISSCFVKE